MRTRRGSALILVLMMTLAVAGLSIAAIFMSSSAGLLSAFYDREREYRLSAEAGLELVRSRLTQDSTIAIPDTGMRQLLSGWRVNDASGTPLMKASVNVYAAMTGDTTGLEVPFVTLIAVAYDANGTRHVRRMDLRRESFSRYAMLVDSFPASATHGPGVMQGRAHTNGTWQGSGSGNTYRDTVTAVVGVTGSGTFDLDSIVGVPRIPYPRDSTYPRLDTLAAAANLAFTPYNTARGTRLEFVAFDADADGTVEAHEGFVKVFDLSSAGGIDTMRLRASPLDSTVAWTNPPFAVRFVSWNSPVVQNQCGAFYLRSGRWHFFPISAHRIPFARNVIVSAAAGNWPLVDSGMMDQMDDFDFGALEYILLNQATARCFPAGSPYLMPSERMTNESGVVTGTAADTIPFGVVVPSGGWPGSAPAGYGGSDSSFTVRSRTCTIMQGSGRCQAGSLVDLGTWRTFGGTAVSGLNTALRQAVEFPYLWPLHSPYNPTARGVVSSRAGPLFVSGSVAGPVTLRVAGRAAVVDEITNASEPNDPAQVACSHRLGILAVGDVLVVEAATTRVRRFGRSNVVFGVRYLEEWFSKRTGGPAFRVHGNLMSLSGTVGVEGASLTMGSTATQIPCPEGASSTTASNAGCMRHIGGAAMRTYSALYSGTNTGARYSGMLDRCQATTKRPPFFPLTNRYTFVRTLELEPSQANTPTKVRSLLLRLKGKSL